MLHLINDRTKKISILKKGDKIKIWYKANKKEKISQFWYKDKDTLTYFNTGKIIQIDSIFLIYKSKKKEYIVILDSIYSIRKNNLRQKFPFVFTVNATIGVSSTFLLPPVPFISFATLGYFAFADVMVRVLEPVILPLKRIKGRRKKYTLIYSKNDNLH